MYPSVLAKFYRAVIESVLTLSITVWYGSTTVDAKKRLQRIVKTAETIGGAPLPSMETIYQKRVLKKASAIVDDTCHSANQLFQLMKSGRFMSFPVTSKRALTSTYPAAV